MNMGNGIWIGTLKLQGSIHSPIDKEDQQLALALALDIITTSPPLIDWLLIMDYEGEQRGIGYRKGAGFIFFFRMIIVLFYYHPVGWLLGHWYPDHNQILIEESSLRPIKTIIPVGLWTHRPMVMIRNVETRLTRLDRIGPM